MNFHFLKKVIRASAGTGKTYRLSLEYIGLLLKFRELKIHFSEILVITFTKKATAEIRERIFQHLDALCRETNEGRRLSANLQSILGIEIRPNDLSYLGTVYRDMLTNKNHVQISTIDSFTSSIFATIITPFLGITSYEISDKLEEQQIAEIYQFLLENPENLEKTLALFARTGRKNIADYEKFVVSLLKKRWAFHLVRTSASKEKVETISDQRMNEHLDEFWRIYDKILQQFKTYLFEDQVQLPTDQILKKDFHQIFKDCSLNDLIPCIQSKIKNIDFLCENQKLFMELKSFWNGSKLLRKAAYKDLKDELEAETQKAAEVLADYLYERDFLREENEIRKIAELVYQKYDEIKFRDKVFTYDDVSYYTFKYLYDPDLSLIEGDSVTNAFYEYLTARTRFMLVDEFQDTSIVQFKILAPMIREIVSGEGIANYGGMIVVGDEKQSIYGWRGGERDLLLRIPDLLGDTDKTTLDVSYRSNEKILEFINAVFGHDALQAKLEEQSIDWPFQSVRGAFQSEDGCIQVKLRNYSSGQKDDNDISRREDTLREFVEEMLLPLLYSGKINAATSAVLARRNDDLLQIAAILDESRIPYVLNSSASILGHRTVKPILFLLRYIVYKDFYDLLRFLRSDYVLMHADELKKVLLAYREQAKSAVVWEHLFAGLKQIPVMTKIAKIIQRANLADDGSISFMQFIKEIVEEFNVIHLFPLESDVKNLHLFLCLAAEFENAGAPYIKNLAGFLAYCIENQEKESWQQLGLEDIDAINLMTIHKSKGLEFENVFLYADISSRGGNAAGALKFYIDYSANYSRVDDFGVTLNFNHVLPLCQKKSLYDSKERRNAIEEMNNYYVAMTRAKTNLFLYFAFRKTGGLEKLMQDIHAADAPSVQELLFSTVYNIIQPYASQSESNKLFAQLGQIKMRGKTQVANDEKDFSFIPNYMKLNRNDMLFRDEQKLEKEKHLDFKTMYIEHRDIDRGNVAHLYLSFIKHTAQEELEYAAMRTIAYYGNLLPKEDIQRIIVKVNDFIHGHQQYFSRSDWPQVFTEYTLFHPDSGEVRLDRLMVNESQRKICIIDYKTGESYEESQMHRYLETVHALPAVKKGAYSVQGKFVEIQI